MRLLALILALSATACEFNSVKSIVPDGGVTPAQELSRWTRLSSPDGGAGGASSAAMDYFAVSGDSPDFVVMVGSRGAITHGHRTDGGVELVAQPRVTSEDLRSVHVVSPMLAYAVGTMGTVLAWDGLAWSAVTSGTTATLLGVWADKRRAFAVGENGSAVGKFGPTMPFAPVTVDSPDDLFAITARNDEVFAVGTLGTISRLNGTGMTATFNRTPVRPGFGKTLAGATTGPGGTFVVGLDGTLFRYDGEFTQLQEDKLPAVFLRGVAAPSGDLFLVGFDNTVVRVRGNRVLVYPDIPERWVNGVWASAPDDVWIVGASGMLLHGPPPLDPRMDGGVPAPADAGRRQRDGGA